MSLDPDEFVRLVVEANNRLLNNWPPFGRIPVPTKPAEAEKDRQKDDNEEDSDPVTDALVAASVPRYRNSDLCPVLGCGRKMYFKQMYLLCDRHGYPY